MFGDDLWAFVVIAGFLILGAAIAFAKLRNRQAGVDKPVRPDATPPNFGETRKVD